MANAVASFDRSLALALRTRVVHNKLNQNRIVLSAEWSVAERAVEGRTDVGHAAIERTEKIMLMRAVHPGEILKEELDGLGIIAAEFARQRFDLGSRAGDDRPDPATLPRFL